jgi:hypothetical protein
MIRSIFLVCLLLVSVCSFGQLDTIYNTKSVEKIPYYEQLYRFKVWRDIDLKEKQNAAFKSPNSDLIRFFIENLKTGALKGYLPNDFYFEQPQANVDEFLADGNPQTADPFDPKKTYFAQERIAYQGKIYSSTVNDNSNHLPTDTQWWSFESNMVNFISENQLSSVTMVEDVIFDKRRSRMYYDIVGFIIKDKDGNPRALVNYKEFYDLVEKTFHSKSMRERSTVMWKNRYNPSEDKSYNDAFKLRLFHGVILKVENPDDLDITTIYTNNKRAYGESVFARWEEEMKMMEKEHNLWEY